MKGTEAEERKVRLDVGRLCEHVAPRRLRDGRARTGADHRLETLRRDTIGEDIEPSGTCKRKKSQKTVKGKKYDDDGPGG